MNLKFAKDSNIFSFAVEQLRDEHVPLTEENIKKRYEEIEAGKKPKSMTTQNAEQRESTSNDNGGAKISDAAQQLAEENEIDVNTIEGTGRGGSITKGDVEKAIAAKSE